MIYLNIKTGQRTKIFISDDITIQVDDSMVVNFFKPLPISNDGIYKRGWSDTEGYIFAFSPNPTQYEVDARALEAAKSNKIKAIDAQTGIDIVSLAGDIYKQLEKTIEHQILVRKKADGEIVDNDRIAELEALSGQVLSLKYEGKDREESVANVVMETTIENALVEIESI